MSHRRISAPTEQKAGHAWSLGVCVQSYLRTQQKEARQHDGRARLYHLTEHKGPVWNGIAQLLRQVSTGLSKRFMFDGEKMQRFAHYLRTEQKREHHLYLSAGQGLLFSEQSRRNGQRHDACDETFCITLTE